MSGLKIENLNNINSTFFNTFAVQSNNTFFLALSYYLLIFLLILVIFDNISSNFTLITIFNKKNYFYKTKPRDLCEIFLKNFKSYTVITLYKMYLINRLI